jgi:hypothetical protein
MTQEATFMTPPIDPKQAASANPAVDVKKLEEVEAFRQKMERAGVARSASYRLSPALGNEKASPAKDFLVRMHRVG